MERLGKTRQGWASRGGQRNGQPSNGKRRKINVQVESCFISGISTGGRERLEEIERRDGAVTAENVLDDSRPAEAVLHPCFEWKDDIAAEKYRLSQSRKLIGNLVIVKDAGTERSEAPKPIEVRAWSNVSDWRDKGRYVATELALSEEKARENILANARNELEMMRQKYQGLIDFNELLREALADGDRG